MNTLNLTQTLAGIQSKLILGVALLAAATAISFAFQHPGHAKNTAIASIESPIQQVVIEGKRMTAEEKLAYDLAPEGIARVEIIGKRLSAEDKLAMNTEDQLPAKHSSTSRRA